MPDLKEYIQEQLRAGFDINTIRYYLQQYGYSVSDIEKAVQSIYAPPIPKRIPWKLIIPVISIVFVIVILSLFAIIFVIGGYDPKVGIMRTLVSTTFSGLAVLCPTTIAALYWKRATKFGCIASIIIGEISIFLFQFKLLPGYGFLSAIWGIIIAILVLIIVSYISPSKK